MQNTFEILGKFFQPISCSKANSRPHLREQTYSVDVNYCRLLQFSPYVCSKVRHLGTEDHPVRIEPAIFKIFSTITYRNSHGRCSIKKGVLKNFAKFTGKHLCQSLFFNNFIKKDSVAQVLSCEFNEIFKKTFFTEYLRTTASVLNLFAQSPSQNRAGILLVQSQQWKHHTLFQCLYC